MTDKKLMHVRVDSKKYHKKHMDQMAQELTNNFPDLRWLVTGDDVEINEIGGTESFNASDGLDALRKIKNKIPVLMGPKLYEHQKLIIDQLNNGKNTIIQTSRQAGLTTVLEEYATQLLLSNDRHININYITLNSDMANVVLNNLRYRYPFLKRSYNRTVYNENTGNNVQIVPYRSYVDHGHHYRGEDMSNTEIVDIYDTCFLNQKGMEMRKIIDLNQQLKLTRTPNIQLVLATGHAGPEFRKTLLTGKFLGIPFENKIRLTGSDVLLLNDGVNDDFYVKYSKAVRDAKKHLNPELYEKDYFLL